MTDNASTWGNYVTADTWRHGCPKHDPCRKQNRSEDCEARTGRGTLTIRRALQQRPWQHGCDPDGSCGRRLGADCPDRRDGGVVESEVKSRAGRRIIGLPQPVIDGLEAHRAHQQVDRERAGDLWGGGRLDVHEPARSAGPPD